MTVQEIAETSPPAGGIIEPITVGDVRRSTLAAAMRMVRIDRMVVVTVLSRLTMVAAGILTSIVTARYLQPSGRGEYFVAVTTAQMLAQFANMGLPASNTYFVARDRSLFTALLSNSLWVSFVAAPLLGLGLIALVQAGYLTNGMDQTTLWFSIALAPLILFNLLASNLFVGLNQLGTFNTIQVASAVLVLPFMLAAGSLRAGSHGFLVASLAGWSAIAAIIFILSKRYAVGPMRFRPDVFKIAFSYTTRAYLATLAAFLVLRINVFTLNAFAGTEQVGYYSIASQLADAVAILPQSIALVLFPRLVSSHVRRVETMVENAIRAGIVLGVICLLLWFAAAPAVQWAFGSRFLPAVPVVRSVLPGILFVGVTAIVSQYLAAGGMPLSYVATWFGGAILTAVMGRTLVPRYGAVGAGATMSVTYGVILIVLVVLAGRMASRRPGTAVSTAESAGSSCTSA